MLLHFASEELQTHVPWTDNLDESSHTCVRPPPANPISESDFKLFSRKDLDFRFPSLLLKTVYARNDLETLQRISTR